MAFEKLNLKEVNIPNVMVNKFIILKIFPQRKKFSYKLTFAESLGR